jgi:hypothetical protein
MVAKINFKIYQGATFEQVLRWESETKVYVPITNITKSAPVAITVSDATKLPPIGWRARVTNVSGMKEINMAGDSYELLTAVEGNTVTLNQINSLAYTTYTSGGVLEYNSPVSLAGYTARMQIKAKAKDATPLVTLTTENGGILLDNTLKTITLNISASSTAGLDFTQAVYDLELISGSGVVKRFAEGSISLKQEITK